MYYFKFENFKEKNIEALKELINSHVNTNPKYIEKLFFAITGKSRMRVGNFGTKYLSAIKLELIF